MTVLKQYNSTSGLWETVVVGGPGPQGPTGATGATGPTGPTGPAGADGVAVGTKLSALTQLTPGSALAVGDLIEVVDISDTSMAASGTNKRLTIADLQGYLKNPAALYNTSTAAQGPGFASDTYVAGSNISIPNGRLQAKTIYRCQIYVSKTAAGTASPALNIRIGTAGTTADTSRGGITFTGAGTAAADKGIFDITASFRSVGSGTSAVLQSLCRLTHALSITGLNVEVSPVAVAVSGGFDSTVASSIIGVSVNGGASAAWTIDYVTAELVNLG
jgi:hypothetical protein